MPIFSLILAHLWQLPNHLNVPLTKYWDAVHVTTSLWTRLSNFIQIGQKLAKLWAKNHTQIFVAKFLKTVFLEISRQNFLRPKYNSLSMAEGQISIIY